MKAKLPLALFLIALVVTGVIADHFKTTTGSQIVTVALGLITLFVRSAIKEEK